MCQCHVKSLINNKLIFQTNLYFIVCVTGKKKRLWTEHNRKQKQLKWIIKCGIGGKCIIIRLGIIFVIVVSVFFLSFGSLFWSKNFSNKSGSTTEVKWRCQHDFIYWYQKLLHLMHIELLASVCEQMRSLVPLLPSRIRVKITCKQ